MQKENSIEFYDHCVPLAFRRDQRQEKMVDDDKMRTSTEN